jgi:hypothetical protein
MRIIKRYPSISCRGVFNDAGFKVAAIIKESLSACRYQVMNARPVPPRVSYFAAMNEGRKPKA